MLRFASLKHLTSVSYSMSCVARPHGGKADASPDAGVLDEAAFETLFDEVTPQLLRLSFVVCGSRDLAEDAVQNAWQKAWSRRSQLRDQTRGRSWLLAITANEARMLARRDRLRQRVDSLLLRRGHPVAMPSDPALVDLRAALAHLSGEDRTLLALKYVAGYTSTEIGRVMRASPASVRVRLSRVQARLRRELEG